jgi:GTP pyrophosphokinase
MTMQQSETQKWNLDEEAEKKELVKRYRAMLREMKPVLKIGDDKIVRKAFEVAVNSHKNMRRKSGEPYIFHPLNVAMTCVRDIGLGTTAVVCALLHDTVEDTSITLQDVEVMFGQKIAKIIDGLTKISGVFDQNVSMQAENFRKMLLTLSDDVRVILIKLADRLDNMRTLDSMSKEKQLKIASETLYLYAPLAHRLGLYTIKTELEDLGFKYTEPKIYNEISSKLKKTQAVRTRFINTFVAPIKRELDKLGFKYTIKGRPKSVYSIYNKMINKKVEFEEIYDLFAIRIILDSKQELEKSDCWRVYSVITDFYTPSPERLRDWISTPKANGYEALHTTLMSPTGKWVEVQIRSKRMDEIAEKGYAAHWKYKDGDGNSGLDEWIGRIRELLENPSPDALDFLDEFKLNLFAEEIYVFTPKGDLKTMPASSTALDFAYEIHSDLGNRCIGAKVNHKLVPISYTLKSGDQIEILVSQKQKPKEEWLSWAVTAKAKSFINGFLKDQKKVLAFSGKNILMEKLKKLKVDNSADNIKVLLQKFNVAKEDDFYAKIAENAIDLQQLTKMKVVENKFAPIKIENAEARKFEEMLAKFRGNKGEQFVISATEQKIKYNLADCCTPIPGDDVIGFLSKDNTIQIHRVTCAKAIELMGNQSNRIVKTKFTDHEMIEFLAGLTITGFDKKGLVNQVTRIISDELNVNMRSISFESHDGVFEGTVMLYVHDNNHLTGMINKLKKVEGVVSVNRIESR